MKVSSPKDKIAALSLVKKVSSMPVNRTEDVPFEEYTGQSASGVKIQRLISEAPNFNMRRFVVDRTGYTPLHKHDYEHEVYVLSGRGVVTEEGKRKKLEAGSVVYVPPNITHQFKNTGREPLVFLCLVPK